MINTIIGKTNDKTCIITKISVGKLDHTSPCEIANIFGKQFTNGGKEYANKIQNNIPINDYLNKILQNKKSMFLCPTTSTEIARIIEKLPNKNSSGWDDIFNKTLKRLKMSLVEAMSMLFNHSLKSGIFPDIMKLANVVPLFKSGKKNIARNY